MITILKSKILRHKTTIFNQIWLYKAMIICYCRHLHQAKKDSMVLRKIKMKEASLKVLSHRCI
jgi:hypothetical protein